MFGRAPTRARELAARLDDASARHGLAYPWWIAAVSVVAIVTINVLALAQRDALFDPRPVTLSLALVIGVFVLEFATEKALTPWWLVTAVLLVVTAWLMSDSPGIARPTDLAPPILAFLAAEVTATAGLRAGLATTALSMALIFAVGVDGRGIHLLEILVGLVVGCMLRWQMRALVAERDARARERERATLGERQRIAREIHDLVGHSLSVTMLHVTGARRALTEDEDVEEAVDALQDAERIGRQAMSDIRRTVQVLATESDGIRPLPSATDIDQLVTDVRTAGLTIDYEVSGDRGSLAPSVGLGVYRVAQESLANVAKHASAERVTLRLDVADDDVRLVARNRRVDSSGSHQHDGNGVAGMTSRAEQLGGRCRVGPDGDEWVVDLVVPVGASGTDDQDENRDSPGRRLVQ